MVLISYERREGTSRDPDPTRWVTHCWDIRLPGGRILKFKLQACWDVILTVSWWNPVTELWRDLLHASPASRSLLARWAWKVADLVYDQIEVARFNRVNNYIEDGR